MNKRKTKMEVKTLPQIRTEEPFRKSWSQPVTIISEEDLKEAENMADNTDGDQIVNRDMNKSIEIVKSANPKMPDIRIHSDSSLDCLKSVQNSNIGNDTLVTSQEVIFRTPQKLLSDYTKRLQSIHSEMHRSNSSSVLNEKADWMLAERSHSRSPPSPAIMSRSPLPRTEAQRSPVSRSPDLRSRSPPIPISPALNSNSSNIFNFSPERTEMYREEMESETRRVKKRLFGEIAMGSQIPVSCDSYTENYMPSHLPPSHHHLESFLSTRLQTRDEAEEELPHYLRSPSCRGLAPTCCGQERYSAKRRLNVDQEYVPIPKRLKIDLEKEIGYRYLQQLESDISSVRHRLNNPPETERKKPSNCTCAIMERQFLEMAESAYRSVRRIDSSPRGFEQFKRELIQTNEVMKDSLDVLKNIRAFCEHKR